MKKNPVYLGLIKITIPSLTNITSEYRTWATAQVSIREAGGQARANLGTFFNTSVMAAAVLSGWDISPSIDWLDDLHIRIGQYKN